MAVYICGRCQQRVIIEGLESHTCPTPFCRGYRAPRHYPADSEVDLDANGVLSNAIRALEEQETSPP